MHIDEISVGSEVVISLKAGDHTFKFNTELVSSGQSKSGRYIACSLITVNGKVLNPGGFSSWVDIHNIKDNRNYRFLLKASAIDKKNKIMYLYSIDDAKAKNYRAAFRVPCSYKVVLQIGNNRNVIDGHVHDVSYTGAAYIFTTGDVEVSEGDEVSGSIYDFEEHIYRTTGKVVRILDDFQPNLTLIGVKFEKDMSLQGLVSRLQRNELRVRGNIKK
ncbi:MAG: PilZ domain-containing protein [Lachnospiraceae bacterium]|nr:PilZ domain-containing protein [Lachnospiraceae bacterium]